MPTSQITIDHGTTNYLSLLSSPSPTSSISEEFIKNISENPDQSNRGIAQRVSDLVTYLMDSLKDMFCGTHIIQAKEFLTDIIKHQVAPTESSPSKALISFLQLTELTGVQSKQHFVLHVDTSFMEISILGDHGDDSKPLIKTTISFQALDREEVFLLPSTAATIEESRIDLFHPDLDLLNLKISCRTDSFSPDQTYIVAEERNGIRPFTTTYSATTFDTDTPSIELTSTDSSAASKLLKPEILLGGARTPPIPLQAAPRAPTTTR